MCVKDHNNSPSNRCFIESEDIYTHTEAEKVLSFILSKVFAKKILETLHGTVKVCVCVTAIQTYTYNKIYLWKSKIYPTYVCYT